MKKTKTKNMVAESKPSCSDERFAHIPNNPIFRKVPTQEKRIDVDERFHSMFHDSKFNLNSKVDKRGKPVTAKSDKRLSTYYTAVGNESKPQKAQSEKLKSMKIKDGSTEIKEDSQSDSSSDSSSEDVEELEENNDVNLGNYVSTLSADIKKKLHDKNVDYARGEQVFASEESSDEDSSEFEEDDDENLMHEWGEIDKDAPRTNDATSRLALCNMDWDQLKAVDLMILFNSFLPTDGILNHVAIYPSEFGKERMAEEEINGPKELAETVISEANEDSDGNYEEDDVNEFQMEKLRKYQLNRLKYYYAVLQFDTAETAEKVYAECDGMEYESSAARIDLRFIPDDMSFDDEPKDKCDRVPDAEKYRPRFFTTTALQQIKVDLTWDETDPMRKELTELMFDPKAKVDDEDLLAYLASSSDEESEEEIQTEENAKEIEKSSQKDRLAKYRSLLEGIEESKNKEKDKDMQMEITWGVGLKKKTEELVKKKNEEEIAKDRTPWEEMLAKQKDKKKQRRKEKKKKATEDSDASDQPFSDDDVDVDLNDDFFKDEITSTRKGRREKSKPDKDDAASEANKAALELLMMDDDDNKSHFSLKKIMAASAEKSKKKKKRKGKPDKEVKTVADNFEINVNDERFSALFSSHHFNVDPSDPNYKKTEAMEKIISEKLKRRPQNLDEKNEIGPSVPEHSHKDQATPENPLKEKYELQSLVKSIKRKAEIMKNVSNKKKLK